MKLGVLVLLVVVLIAPCFCTTRTLNDVLSLLKSSKKAEKSCCDKCSLSLSVSSSLLDLLQTSGMQGISKSQLSIDPKHAKDAKSFFGGDTVNYKALKNTSLLEEVVEISLYAERVSSPGADKMFPIYQCFGIEFADHYSLVITTVPRRKAAKPDTSKGLVVKQHYYFFERAPTIVLHGISEKQALEKAEKGDFRDPAAPVSYRRIGIFPRETLVPGKTLQELMDHAVAVSKTGYNPLLNNCQDEAAKVIKKFTKQGLEVDTQDAEENASYLNALNEYCSKTCKQKGRKRKYYK